MQIERERKYALTSAQYRTLLGLARSRGAKRQRLTNTYYDTPGQDLLRRGARLRIRTENFDARLTLKSPLGNRRPSGDRVSTEIDLNVPRLDAEGFLLGLGYRRLSGYVTLRYSWREGSTVVSLDRIQGIGSFCEIEAASLGAQLEITARKLDLRADQLESRGYLDLALKARTVRGFPPRRIA